MVRYDTIFKSIEEYVSKCSITIREMHSLLEKWSSVEKETLLYYGLDNFDEEELDKYHFLLQEGSDDEIFDYEKQVFDNLTKTQRENLLTYCTDFQEKDYKEDFQLNYPTSYCGEMETAQIKLQEEKGYPKGFEEVMDLYWGGGFYQEIQDYILKGKMPPKSFPKSVRDNVINSAKSIMDYIDSSEGLMEDVILWRGGHWDENLKVGQVKELPCLNSTSYQKDAAETVGIKDEPLKDNYLIKIYAPKGTKGCCADTDSLIIDCPEHEYLLNKNQKYIVLGVDKSTKPKTATIKLIND